MDMVRDKYKVLKESFGYDGFREGQEDIVDSILSGSDVLCVMPTGAGKSLCYQVPALILDGITLVVSPLIALMKDQVAYLVQNGIPAAYINSSLNSTQYARVIQNIYSLKYKIVYVAPERLMNSDFIELCKSVNVSMLAVDEAHCISQWGQDFRPSYLKITNFISELKYRPIIAAFTATATSVVKRDIEESLRLCNPFKITTGFDRPNLQFAVINSKKKPDDLLKLLKSKKNKCGIIYCSTRKTVEAVFSLLNHSGISASMYHAGLDNEVRRKSQDDFVYDKVSIMVATNAFGMGIDKSNVSFVIHYNMPRDIESYYQEAGRAGRDGQNADCILLYAPSDVRTNRFLIDSCEPNGSLSQEEQEAVRANDLERLRQMTFYSTTNSCLRAFILNYFGEKAPIYCGNCSNCLTQFEKKDVTVDAQKILSCIKRTGERFGRKMIIDVLRGSKGDKVLRFGLNTQSTYGLMSEQSEQQLRDIFDFLEYNGYIVSSEGDRPTLSISDKAKDILSDNVRLVMSVPKAKVNVTGQEKDFQEEADNSLLDRLKQLRRRLASEKKVPAYVIFSDSTLIDMCKKLPRTEEELLEVSGVGQTKLILYGSEFLSIIKEYTESNI